MILTDVNVLVAGYRDDHPEHARCRDFLQSVLTGQESFGTSGLVVSGFLRIVTLPRIFARPSPLEHAITFARVLLAHPHAVPVSPGQRHWEIFSDLCRKAEARGNLIPDAYLAAMAIESGCEWITLDGDFARFPGLRWRMPPRLEESSHTVRQGLAVHRRDR